MINFRLRVSKLGAIVIVNALGQWGQVMMSLRGQFIELAANFNLLNR